MPHKIVAFVARSFDPTDEAKIDPIIKLLDSFKPLGFIAESAERSEVESVSEKVRSLIDKSQVFIGIFTQRHRVYRLNGRLKTAWSALRDKLTPTAWSAPPWVLQESGYALKANKDLVLFRETGVEIPGLQGDLEYIPFDSRNPMPALHRANEMITSLIAKAGGIKVETVVQSEAVEVKPEAPAPTGLQAEAKPEQTAKGEESFKSHFWDLYEAVSSGNWEEAKRQYNSGLDWIRRHEPKEELFWECIYQRQLFNHGKTEALDRLREIASKNKSEHLPRWYMGLCLTDLREHDEASKCYLEAAAIAEPDHRASLEIQAADALKKAKRPLDAKRLLLKVRESEYAKEPKAQFGVLKALYSVSRELDDKFASFAIGELALHQRPEEADFRFSLAFDYGDDNQNHMSLYHYKVICDNDEKNAGALNNLAIAQWNSDLHIVAVQRFKQSYKLGNTLAASNLAHKHLSAGLSDEAIALLKEAENKDNCVPDVSTALAAVHNKIQEDNEGQEKVVAEAQQNREFLLAFAPGLFSQTPIDIQGKWKLPSGEIELRANGTEVSGLREETSQVSAPMSFLFPETAPKTVTRTASTEFSGTLSGRTCKFKLEVTYKEEPSGWTFSKPSDSKTEGYIVFSEDGNSADMTELKAGKPEKYYKIPKATSV